MYKIIKLITKNDVIGNMENTKIVGLSSITPY
jgi:hypothetical protein